MLLKVTCTCYNTTYNLSNGDIFLFKNFLFLVSHVSVSASWPRPSIDALGEDIAVLVSFWNTMLADKKHLKSFTVSSSLDSVLEAPERTSIYMSSDKSYGDVAQQVILLC